MREMDRYVDRERTIKRIIYNQRTRKLSLMNMIALVVV